MDVPPDHDAVNVIVLPTFWVDGREGEEDKEGIPKTEFTTTSLFMLFTVAGVEAESVTNIQ